MMEELEQTILCATGAATAVTVAGDHIRRRRHRRLLDHLGCHQPVHNATTTVFMPLTHSAMTVALEQSILFATSGATALTAGGDHFRHLPRHRIDHPHGHQVCAATHVPTDLTTSVRMVVLQVRQPTVAMARTATTAALAHIVLHPLHRPCQHPHHRHRHYHQLAVGSCHISTLCHTFALAWRFRVDLVSSR